MRRTSNSKDEMRGFRGLPQHRRVRSIGVRKRRNEEKTEKAGLRTGNGKSKCEMREFFPFSPLRVRMTAWIVIYF
jgi:hypothetical protein